MLETGKIYEGKVKGITNYGAFVEVPQEDGKSVTGMVHISEIANTFVNDIHDFLSEGQDVQVIVLQTNAQGKISMSIRKILPEETPQQKPRPSRRQNQNGGRNRKSTACEPKPACEMTFEDMINHFKQNSEERMSDIKRNTDRKNRSHRRSK